MILYVTMTVLFLYNIHNNNPVCSLADSFRRMVSDGTRQYFSTLSFKMKPVADNDKIIIRQ